VTLEQIEAAQRVEASTWAVANGLTLIWGNGAARDPHAQPSLVWQFLPGSQRRVTAATVLHTGRTEGRIYLPAGTGIVDALALAESLESLFRGRIFAGSEMLDEIEVTNRGRDGASWRVDVSIPWEWDEKRIPQGTVGIHETPGAVIAYQAVRQLWEQHVRGPLGLVTHWNNEAPKTAQPPFCLAGFRTLQPIGIEMRTIRVPGRVLAGLHVELGTGTAAAEAAITAITRAFDQITYRGIEFGTPLVNRIGRSPINTWQANVRLPFHYDVRT
jgi:hypothetical protein